MLNLHRIFRGIGNAAVSRRALWLAIALGAASCAFAQPTPPPPANTTVAQEKALSVEFAGKFSFSAPQGWRMGNQTRDAAQIYVPAKPDREKPPLTIARGEKSTFVVASEAGMLITVEHRRDHAEAVRRLAEIASEYPEPAEALTIAGWPAIERRYRSLMPQLGGAQNTRGNTETLYFTTAIAVADRLIRFNTMLAPDADPKLLEEARTIGRALAAEKGSEEVSKRELEAMQRTVKQPAALPLPPADARDSKPFRPGKAKEAGTAVQVQAGVGELEVASNDGQHVVVAANSGYRYSDDFGVTFTGGGATPCNQAVCDGDPSITVGKSGTFYYSWMGGATGLSNDGVSRSIDNGHTFTFQGMAASCPGTTACSSPDQEHMAADRNNAAMAGGDRIYNVWRDFGTPFSIRISCSTDSGANWTAGVAIAAGDFPRVSVGGDGFVYVAWPSGGNMMLHKYSNCDAGLVAQVGWPVTVSAFNTVVCPVPGLDRCNGRNILSSPKIAIDDLDPAHIYYVFATSTAAGNEDIMVFDSTNGGATFPRSVRVNAAVAGRRFMPWVSAYGGMAVVSWYDRRFATMANNDLTRYYVGGATVRGPNLEALAETDLSGVNDQQCSLWPCATNAVTDSTSCSVQPQLGGICWTMPMMPPPPMPYTRCDFATTVCPGALTCTIGRGCPKYGDYNGNAVGAGRAYSAWASSTPPASVGGAGGALRVYASADRIPSDFYVRDWNDSPTQFDNGAQPSTHASFWSTSDVWNQSTNVAAAPGPGGYVVGDAPSRASSNYTFARVSRRIAAMPTAPAAPVTVHFYLGDYGLGAAFVDIGSEIATFATGTVMTAITPPHAWTAPVASSNHLCLAVQIVGPDGDTFALPSIVGTAPGPADPLILIDNNKAQRNLQDTIGTADGTELFATIRNAESKAREMRLRVKLPPGVKIKGTFHVIGGATFEIADGMRIDMGKLAPGEARWLRFHASSLVDVDKPVPIEVFEDTDPPANGFVILLHRDSIENVAKRNLIDLASVMSRLAKIEKNAAANALAVSALRAAKNAGRQSYLAYLQANRTGIGQILAAHFRTSKQKDAFDILAAANAMGQAVLKKDADLAATTHTALIERLDAHLTDIIRNKSALQ